MCNVTSVELSDRKLSQVILKTCKDSENLPFFTKKVQVDDVYLSAKMESWSRGVDTETPVCGTY